MPQLWVIGGPNGAGKSTLVRRYLRRPLRVVNPDEIARRIAAGRVDDTCVQLAAGRLAIAERALLLDAAEDFLVETTLTGHSEIRLMLDAREQGYKVTLVYVGLNRPEVSHARVAARVAQGGHDVPHDAISRRFERSVANLTVAAAAVDRLYVLDNTGTRPRLLIAAETGRHPRIAPMLPSWLRALVPSLSLPS